MKDPSEYIGNMSVWGMIHAMTIRSPVARGSLKGIKCPRLPKGYHLITAKHIPGKNELSDFSIPVLADNVLSYIGQPVAILSGPDESVLLDLSSNIIISADEEDPVFSIKDFKSENCIVERDIVSGDPFKALGEGGIIVSGTYITEIQEHWYSEPHGALAVPYVEKNKAFPKTKVQKKSQSIETFTIYTATQWPFHVKRSVSVVLGLNEDAITVTPTLMAIHLDGKIWYPSLVSCHAALAAMVTKHPVKLMLRRDEDFLYSPKRNKAEIEIASALGEDGVIQSSILDLKLDLGVEGVFKDEIIDHSSLAALGLYNHAAYKIDSAGIRTNIPPQGPMAGFGLSQGFFASECHFSRIADYIGQDPAEWRKNNLIKKNQNFAIGIPIKEAVPLAELIDAVAFMSDYYRKWASYELLRKRRRSEKWELSGVPLRGIGISTACQGNGFLHFDAMGNSSSTVEVTLEKDGFLEIKSSIISSSNRYLDTWQNLANEILGVNPTLVRLTGNTGEAPDSGPGTLSRNIGVITKLVERCFTAIRKQRFRSPLPITVKRSMRPLSIKSWTSKNINPEVFAHPGWGAAVSEIEIDPVSFEPNIRGIWLMVDGGNILSERWARRSLHTGVIQALGWACREKIKYEEGEIFREFYNGFNIPAIEEIPPIKVDFYNSDSDFSKGIGDIPFSCVPAAFVQAVSQAMDHHFEKIPLDSKDIWEAWRLKQPELSK